MEKNIVRLILFAMVLVNAVTLSATNRALVVGIGNYNTDRTGWSKIHGDNDVDLIVAGLINNGYSRSNILTLKNSAATKTAIVSSLERLANVCKPGDMVMFHFSGHGQPISDLNGDERTSSTIGFDESIIPYDAYRTPRYKVNGRNYQGENHLIDDQLNGLFDAIKKKIGQKGCLFISIDACFSQGMEMDDDTLLSSEELAQIGPARGTSHKFRLDRSNYLSTLPKPKDFSQGGKLIIVSACKATERNFEYKLDSNTIYGSLSYYLSELLKKDADFNRWEKCFKERKYLSSGIFVSVQHPVVKSYK
ncbi:MAG: caspase family protein [Muribaculum sp.]|nr:caspase family protein [Muribaculum sp.]